MKRLQSKLYFCMIIALMLAILTPVNGVLAANAGKEIYTYESGPMFDPLVQKDGNLLISDHKIVKDVYHSDLMKITPNGKRLKKLSKEGKAVYTKSKSGTISILLLNEKKKTVEGYDMNFKRKWKTAVNQDMNIWETDENGGIYFITDHEKSGLKITKVDSKGERIQFPTTKNVADYKIEDDGSVVVFLQSKDYYDTKLRKINANGSHAWQKTVLDRNYKGNKNTLLVEAHLIHADKEGTMYLTAKYEDRKKSTVDDYIYYDTLYAIDRSGKRLWKRDLGTDFYSTGGGTVKNTLYVGEQPATLFLNKKNGKVLRKVGQKSDDVWALVQNGKGPILRMENNKINAFSESGKKLWNFNHPKGRHTAFPSYYWQSENKSQVLHAFDGKDRLYIGTTGKDSWKNDSLVVLSAKGKRLADNRTPNKLLSGIITAPDSSNYYAMYAEYKDEFIPQFSLVKYSLSSKSGTAVPSTKTR